MLFAKIMCGVQSYSFWYFEIDCDIKTSEILSFLPLNNNAVIIGLS